MLVESGGDCKIIWTAVTQVAVVVIQREIINSDVILNS